MRRAVGGAVALGLCLTAAALTPAAAAPRPLISKQTTTLAPGVTYTRITDASVPLRTYVITLEPAKAASLDVQAAGSTFGRYSTTSRLGAASNALAAINGDFSSDGMPVHPFAEEAALKGAGLNAGSTFAISKDEANLYLKGGARAVVTGLNAADGTSFTVDRWNSGPPANGEMAGFTSAGGSVQKPPSGSCSARLLPSSSYRWASGKRGVTRDYAVDVVRCQSEPVATSGGVVLAANRYNDRADQIKAMDTRTTVSLTWDIESWAGVTDVVGGAPQLLAGGRVVADNNCGTYFCDRNPRAGIGYTADGRVLLVVVDGRSNASVGLTPVGFANAFRDLGATHALNLDGGGGATMWVKGRGIVNRPSDGSERPVTNAVLVLPGSDRDEPGSLRAATLPAVSPEAALAAERAAMSDPASTGGLLSAYGD